MMKLHHISIREYEDKDCVTNDIKDFLDGSIHEYSREVALRVFCRPSQSGYYAFGVAMTCSGSNGNPSRTSLP